MSECSVDRRLPVRQRALRGAPQHRDGYYCHCRMCQLAFGNTRAAYLNLRKDQVTLADATGVLPSSKIARRGFCNRCGTPLSFEFIESQNMDLSVGSLDDPSLLKPIEHWSVETRIADWHADDGLPGTRLDRTSRSPKRWKEAYGRTWCRGVTDARTVSASRHGSRDCVRSTLSLRAAA
jgi:hypothetical protein